MVSLNYGDQQEPPVAVCQVDSYASSFKTARLPIFDLARTDALRGPQGTLFGRNAIQLLGLYAKPRTWRVAAKVRFGAE